MIVVKLNPDCVRKVLLCLENVETYVMDEDGDIRLHGIFIEELFEKIPDYTKPEIYYTLSMLEDGGFLNMTSSHGNNALQHCHISSLTYAGHELLESIRDDGRWKFVKSGLSAVRNYSLSAVEAIAEGATSAAISSYLAHAKNQL